MAVLGALGLLSPAVAAAQGDWDRAEDTAIGDQTADVYETGAPAEPSDEAGDETDPLASGSTAEEDHERSREEREDQAEDDEERPLFGRMERGGAFHVFGDIGTFFGTADIAGNVGIIGQTEAFSLTPWFGVAYDLTEALTISGQWGFSMLAHGDINLVAGTSVGGGVALIAGNPILAGRWRPYGDGDGPITWGIDLEIGLPASTVGNLAELTAMNSAIGSRGAWDLWHWANGVFSLVPGAFLRWEASEAFVLEFEADLGLLLGVGNGRPSTIGVLQVGVDASFRLAESIGLGMRLWGVLDGEIFPGRDDGQLALAPYLPLFFDPLWLRAEFILNLTAPYGVSFSDGKWWGARLVAGVEL